MKLIFGNILNYKTRLLLLVLLLNGGLLFSQVEEPKEEEEELLFPIENRSGGLFLSNQIEYDVIYDPIKQEYILWPMIGSTIVSDPIYLTKDEYYTFLQNTEIKKNYRSKSQAYDQKYRETHYGDEAKINSESILPSFKIKSRVFDMIFGGDKIELIPQGYANLELGVLLQKIDNPLLLPQNRKTFAVDLRQRIQLSILGKIGENLQLKVNYDTQAGFAFENQMKLQWNKVEGGEDDIIQNIEVGNISMPLSTSLISGAQALFGVRADLKFGKTFISTVFSEQRSEAKNITVQGGGVLNTFKVFAEDYEYNKHFFLGHYFRDHYDKALEKYPLISSEITITRLEVWRIDKGGGNKQNRRSILALRDLGEEKNHELLNWELYDQVSAMNIRDASDARVSMNGFNYKGTAYNDGEEYLINENARKLEASEFTFYPSLGYISLTQPLLDGEDLLAVSFQYTRPDRPNQIFKVGEMSDEQQKVLVTKLIKPNASVNVASPMWNLMMKNIYSLNAYNISSEDFMMNIQFKDNSEGSSGTINYLPEPSVANQTLLQLLHMDRLNQNGNVQADANGNVGDGLFDYIPGITINAENGSIVFTTVEPFGNYLNKQLNEPANSPYVFKELYRKLPNTLSSEKLAQRYSLTGRYKGAVGDGIPLGAFNVPQGSVKVTANGMTLIEGADYVVDYQLGRVKILNQQLKDSGTPINISLENQSTFNMQKKRFIGLNVEHRFSDRFLIGGTIVNYQEKSLTRKSQFGNEPVSNTIFGLHTRYSTESEFLTRITNRIPGVKTDAVSQISIEAEAAYLKPGVNKSNKDKSYIDDFEDSQSRISLMDASSWKFGSTPGKPAGLNSINYHPFFPNGIKNDDLSYGNGRSMMSWYTIDPRFYGIGGKSPLSDNQISNHMSRRVQLREIYNQKELIAGSASYMNTFDITYYPQLRGPYNVNPDVKETKNWGAMMRPLSVTNFVDANVEYIEFWMMDPYADGKAGSGELLIHLGNVSEDILKDGKMMYENGMPHSGEDAATSTTVWGKQPQNYPILYSFSTDGDRRREQDLGFNGLTDLEEASAYPNVAAALNPVTNENDPAADNYIFYLDGRWGNNPAGNTLQGRYRYFRGPQGNNSTSNPLESSSLTPDVEDINGDFNLDQTENYAQYTLKIDPQSLQNNTNNLVVATKEVDVKFANGQSAQKMKWYQIRIPVDGFDLDLDGDGIDDIATESDIAQVESVLTSARFMRMVVRDFDEEVTLRFGTFDLVRSSWRKYPKNIYPYTQTTASEEEGVIEDNTLDDLEIGEVNIEQNSTNKPPYVVPPGVVRDESQGVTGYQTSNEASMTLKAKLTTIHPSKAVYKSVNLDLRRYKKLEMFVHAQDLKDKTSQKLDTDTKLFIRLGSDYTDNYYEYELPLKYTSSGAQAIASEIWPDVNKIDLSTNRFTDAKKKRDADDLSTSSRFEYIFDDANPEKKIFLKGRPSLGSVSSLMIGVRTTGGVNEKEVLLWVNELRLSDIDNEGGYAARANVAFNLGDFAQVQLSGSISSVGFGAIDQGPSQRNQDESKEYSINTQVQLDKFLPEKWGLQIPFNFSISEQFIDPKYNPLDDDIEFKDAPNKSELKKVVRTYSQQKSFSFSNVRKIRNAKRPARFYDISNFSLSWMYASDYYRDIYTAYDLRRNLRTSLNYNYNHNGKYYQPFENWKAVQDTAKSAQYLDFVKEFNINPIPTRFSFRTDISRTYTERQYRDLSQYVGGGNSSAFSPSYSNNYLFSWQYNLGFDLTKSFRIDFTSSTTTLNDGMQFQRADKDLIWNDLFRVGRPVNYDQQIRLNYKLPFSYFKYLTWINAEAGYTADYNWQASSSIIRENNLGNTAQNARSINLLGDLDFTKLYPEFSGYRRYEEIYEGRKSEIDSLNQAYEQLALSKTKRKVKRKAYKFKNKYEAKDIGWMVLSSLKRGQFNYTKTRGAVIPGILSEPNFFGMGKNSGGPGLGFLFGTDFDIKRTIIEKNWVTDSKSLLDPYQMVSSSDFMYSALIEPMPSLRIDLNAKRNSSFRSQHTGFNLPEPNRYIDELYTLTSSNINVLTSFKNADDIYKDFIKNTQIISERLASARGGLTLNPDGYYDGFGLSSTAVLLPAFVAAIEGKSASKVGMGHNKKFPLPNWSISYTGLKNRPLFARYFDQIELVHSYISSYTVGNVQSNPNYFINNASERDGNQNFYTRNIYGTVSMVESFAPLVGIDMTFRNNVQIRAQYNKDRIMTMSVSNYTISEDYGKEYIVGAGYIFKDLRMKLRYQGRQKTFKGDLNIRGDISIRDNETVIRRVLEDDSQITGGQRLFSFKLSADYDLSQNLNIKFYWDQLMTKYKISTAYPITTIRAGLSATFTFGN